jgi:hypothetical protein
MHIGEGVATEQAQKKCREKCAPWAVEAVRTGIFDLDDGGTATSQSQAELRMRIRLQMLVRRRQHQHNAAFLQVKPGRRSRLRATNIRNSRE